MLALGGGFGHRVGAGGGQAEIGHREQRGDGEQQDPDAIARHAPLADQHRHRNELNDQLNCDPIEPHRRALRKAGSGQIGKQRHGGLLTLVDCAASEIV
jgi:hypothetical protein